MSLRRLLTVICTVVFAGIAIPGHGEARAEAPVVWSAKPESAADHAGVLKSDSQLTVVEAEDDAVAPIVDTAAKKKKSSFWSNKMFHPTQWFSSSKKKK
jgi:hypothetical protein